MCCSETTPSSTPRVGARVDFFSSSRGHLGNLLFLNPSAPASPLATHVRFSPKTGVSIDDSDDVMVSIHLTGDLTKPIEESGLLQQFTLPLPALGGVRGTASGHGLDMALGDSLSLNVGGDGIIGRRVTMVTRDGMLADGIVGFNSAPVVSVSA